MNHPTPATALARRPFPSELADALAARFGDRFSTSAGVREHHGRDESRSARTAGRRGLCP
jgi:D-lactate dehydrogenase (cytochrome)